MLRPARRRGVLLASLQLVEGIRRVLRKECICTYHFVMPVFVDLFVDESRYAGFDDDDEALHTRLKIWPMKFRLGTLRNW